MQKNQLKTTEIVVNQAADAVKAPFLSPPAEDDMEKCKVKRAIK